MKKLFCFLLCLTMIFSSVSLSFAAVADWTTTDQQNLSNSASYLNTIKNYFGTTGSVFTLMQTMNTTLTNINNKLIYGGQSIASIVDDISGWMSPIFNAITNVPVDLNTIIGALGYTVDGTYYPYLREIYLPISRIKPSDWTSSNRYNNANYNLVSADGTYNFTTVNSDGNLTTLSYSWTNGTPLGNIALFLQRINQANANMFNFNKNATLTGYNSSQNVLNWGSLTNSTFTPSSATDGIYKYLASIQAPVARLSYVLANEQEIEARDAAAANQEAVVDNFIESSGNGAASTSDIGSMSDLSAGYKQNFGTDASVSGIFNIFDSNNMGWFSQETKDQLDTTTTTRSTKGSETPLLDKQIEDIYNALGVKQP